MLCYFIGEKKPGTVWPGFFMQKQHSMLTRSREAVFNECEHSANHNDKCKGAH